MYSNNYLEDLEPKLNITYTVSPDETFSGHFDFVPEDTLWAEISQKVSFVGPTGQFLGVDIKYKIYVGEELIIDDVVQESTDIDHINGLAEYQAYGYESIAIVKYDNETEHLNLVQPLDNLDLVVSSVEELEDTIMEIKATFDSVEHEVFRREKTSKVLKLMN